MQQYFQGKGEKMKSLSILLVAALITSSIFTALISTSPNASAVDFTPTPAAVRLGSNVKESLSMSVSDDGRIYVSWAERVVDNSEIMYSYSSNNGTTFSPTSRVNKNSAGTQRAPEVATGNNSMYVAWEDGLSDGGNIILSRSVDGGLTFNETHASDREEGTQSNPTLAVNGNRIAVAWEEYRSDNTIRIWKGTDGALVREISGHQAAVRAVEYSPNGTYLASGSEDATTKIWNAATGSLVRNITTHTGPVTSVNWSANGKLLATGSDDHDVVLLNTTGFIEEKRLNQVNGMLTDNFVSALSFSPNSSKIAVAYNGRYGTGAPPSGVPSQHFNLTVWNLTGYSNWTRNEFTPDPDKGHTSSVTDVAFSHNGTYIATSGKDSTLKIWDSATGQRVRNVNLVQWVHSISWSADDTHIAAGLGNGSIAIVNISNVADISWLQGSHNGRVNAIDWSSVSNEIISGASDPVAKVWHSVFKTERLNLSGHTNSVYSIDWSSNGLSIVTAGGISNQYGMKENQIFCAVSDDGGLTFSPPAMVSDSCSGNRLRPKAAMDPTGTISIVWYDSRSGSSNIYFANSTNLGASFGKNIGIDTLSTDCSIPDIFMDGSGTAHVVWQFNIPPSVRYANSTDNFAQSRVMAANAQLPQVAGSPDGSSLWVSYRQQNQTTKLNYTRAAISYTHGASFTGSVVLNYSNKFVGEHALFVDRHNQTYVAWEIQETPNRNIYHRTTVLSDSWGPSVISTLPANGDTAVSIFTTFSIRFSEPMNRIATEMAFSWSDGTTSWLVGDCMGNQGVWNTYGDTVIFTPKIPLMYQKSTYSFKVMTTATDLAGNHLVSNLTFSFTTSADVDPPKIEHFPSQNTVSYDKLYNIMAIITDQWGTVDSARLYYQGVDDITPASSVEMVLSYTDTYMASIPAQLSLGTIYYYIQASDTFNNVARNPVNYTNQSQLYNVSVVDGVKPDISHVQVTEADVFNEIGIWAVVKDSIQLHSVALNFRPIGSVVFTNTPMLPGANGTASTFRCQIPQQTSIGQIQYNITARDSSGNFNSTSMFTIQIIDRTSPLINYINFSYQKNQTEVLVTANVTDDVGVNSVVLYFKAVGGNQWVQRQMTHVSGDNYTFTIPAQSKSGMIYYYVNATDLYGNQASTLTEQDQFQVEVVGIGMDYTLYYILGGVLAALLIVMVYLVVKKFSRPPRVSEDEEPSEGSEETVPDKVDEAP
jgi:WD40 repeat protein